MCKKVLYGVEFDTEEIGTPRKLRSSLTIAAAKAFSSIMNIGRFQKSQLDILVNEIMRGRLDATDIEKVEDIAHTILCLQAKGFTTKDIAILRSLYFEFDEIMEFARNKKRVDKVIKESGIDDPEIEAIYGLTSSSLTEWYVTYKEARGFSTHE